jgi:hypothetical protein
VHPELVIEPGIDQFSAAALILVATIGITFSLQARFADSRPADTAARLVLAALALLVLLHPDERIGAVACVPVLALIAYWLVRRRDIPYAAAEAAAEPADAAPTGPIVDTERGRMQ